MLAPQSGQIRLRIAEIKLKSVFVTTEIEAIRSLPVVAVLHRRMHKTVSGAASAFAEGQFKRAAASRFGYQSESKYVTNCCASFERSNGDSSAERWALMRELAYAMVTSEKSLSDCLANCHYIDTSKNEFCKHCFSRQGRIS